MEAASLLYGVTMQELGVSKLVSVRFGETNGAPKETRELVEATTG
jgi:chromosome segregation ATPase